MNDKTKILIIDDTPAILEQIQETLKREGYEIFAANSGEKALQKINMAKPDLVLLDIIMPGIDGYETCRQIKTNEEYKDIPVMYMSALSETFDKVKAFSTGAVDYITKPLNPEELLARIKTHVSISKLQKQLTEANTKLEEKVQKRTAELKESENRLLSILEAAEIIAWEANPDTEELFEAGPTGKFFGQSKDFSHGVMDTFANSIHPDDRNYVMESLARTLRGESSYTVEFRVPQPNGEIRWLAANGSLKYDAERKTRRLLGVARDITKQKQAEEERKQAQRQLKTIVENFPDFISRFDEQGRFLYVNPAIEKNFGFSLEQCLGKTLFDINAPGPSGQNEKLHRAILQVFKQGSPNVVEAVWPTPKGEHIFEVRHFPEMNAHGEVESVLGITRDITERRKAEEEVKWNLKVNEALSSMFIPLVTTGTSIEQIANAVLEKSQQLTNSTHGYIAEIDPVNGDLIAHTHTKMIETKCTILKEELRKIRFARSADGLYNALWGHALNTKEPFYDNAPTRHPASTGIPEGHITIERFLTVPVMLAGELVGQIALSNSNRAYTDRDLDAIKRIAEYYALAIQYKRVEEEIRLLNQDLEKRVAERTSQLEMSNKELEAFSYSASHDLRAPLRSIDGFSQVLLDEYGTRLDSLGKDYLNRIRGGAQRMSQLIDDMLKISKVTRSEMKIRVVNLSAMAHEIAADLKHQEENRKVEFIIQDNIKLKVDRHLMQIVLENLLENAWKFTWKKPSAQIDFGMTQREHVNVYYVRDNGAGFDMKYANKLFGAFQRLHSTEDFSGTGIGLATVQRIIHRHGGKIWAEGEEGKGATFYFTLPQKER